MKEIISTLTQTRDKYLKHIDRNWDNPAGSCMYACHWIIAFSHDHQITIESRNKRWQGCGKDWPTQYTKEDAEKIVAAFKAAKPEVSLDIVEDRVWYHEQVEELDRLIGSVIESAWESKVQADMAAHTEQLDQEEEERNQ